jgi:hypothetical protein
VTNTRQQLTNCVKEEERRIPLYQHSLVELEPNHNTSQFVSKVERKLFDSNATNSYVS